jgi:V/A-type H+-transporting ATPase subunit I
MIGKMTRYAFILLSGEKEDFIRSLQETGLVDISRSEKPVDERSAALLQRAQSHLKVISDAEAVRAGVAAEIAALRKEADALRPWGDFDPKSFAPLLEAGYRIHYYAVTPKQFRKAWPEEYPIQIVAEKPRVHFVAILPEGVENPLPVAEIPAPEYSYKAVEERIAAAEIRLKEETDRVEALRARETQFEEEVNRDMAELDRYLATVAANPAAENTIVTYTGYALTSDDAVLREKLDALGVFYLAEPATVEDAPPIALKNNRFVRMFEVLTDMYGRPSYDGFDPTPFLSVFFLLFFALCMGDAGYGIILTVIGILLGRSKGMKDLSPLVITLGVGTTVVGFFLHTFFSMNIAEWPLFEPVKGIFLPDKIAGYDGAMVLSLVIGVLHVCLALIVKTIQATRNHGFLHSLGTWGWTLLIVGGVIVGAFALAGVIDAALTKWIIIGLGSVSALGILFFNTPGRNPLINFGSGLWDTYNTATGLLSDVLSYLRLYALGLAGAMLGYAFNDLGLMILGDGGVGNWIFFIVILIIGHTLNIAMCALGAFVHPLRLNFLEFFKNSGYEGTGRNFRPLTNK